jgi:CheY-like chemotaxis protein
MIVDDDTDDIDIFIEAVNEVDPAAQCVQAKNGLVAMDILHSTERNPDYIFVDMNMPKMNGRQFIAEIRKDRKFDEIKIIVYSTSKQLGGVDGAAQFISKPTTQQELCLAISNVISV